MVLWRWWWCPVTCTASRSPMILSVKSCHGLRGGGGGGEAEEVAVRRRRAEVEVSRKQNAPRHLLELVDVDDHRRRPHRVRLPAQPRHELVDDVRLPGGHHVAEVEARRVVGVARLGSGRSISGLSPQCTPAAAEESQKIARRRIAPAPNCAAAAAAVAHIVLLDHLAEPRVLDELHHRVRPVHDDVAHRALLLLDHEGRDLVGEGVGLAVVRREQPRQPAHLAARVARPLQLVVVVHHPALPRLVRARRRRQDHVVRPPLRPAARRDRRRRRRAAGRRGRGGRWRWRGGGGGGGRRRRGAAGRAGPRRRVMWRRSARCAELARVPLRLEQAALVRRRLSMRRSAPKSAAAVERTSTPRCTRAAWRAPRRRATIAAVCTDDGIAATARRSFDAHVVGVANLITCAHPDGAAPRPSSPPSSSPPTRAAPPRWRRAAPPHPI